MRGGERLSFREYLKHRWIIWLGNMEENWYALDGADAFILALLIWGVCLYVMGFTASDCLVTGIGGVGIVLLFVVSLVKSVLEDYRQWQIDSGKEERADMRAKMREACML